jgi:hypothetical protein
LLILARITFKASESKHVCKLTYLKYCACTKIKVSFSDTLLGTTEQRPVREFVFRTECLCLMSVKDVVRSPQGHTLCLQFPYWEHRSNLLHLHSYSLATNSTLLNYFDYTKSVRMWWWVMPNRGLDYFPSAATLRIYLEQIKIHYFSSLCMLNFHCCPQALR